MGNIGRQLALVNINFYVYIFYGQSLIFEVLMMHKLRLCSLIKLLKFLTILRGKHPPPPTHKIYLRNPILHMGYVGLSMEYKLKD